MSATSVSLGFLADLLSNIPWQDGLARENRRNWNFVGCELVDDPTNGWLTITTTGDPDLPLDASVVTANTVQSPLTQALTINGALDATESILFTVAGAHVLSLGQTSGATVIRIPLDRAGFALGWAGNATSGPGTTTSFFGHGADQAGQPGGAIQWHTGPGGAGAVGGNFDINVNGAVSNVSAEIRGRADGFRIFTFAQRGASLAQLDFGQNSSLVAGVIRATSLSLFATTGTFTKTHASIANGSDIEVYAGAGNAESRKIKGYATTTTANATPLVVDLFTPDNDTVVHFEARITAYKDSSTRATYRREASLGKTGGTVSGTAAVAASPHTGEDAAGWDVSIAGNSGAVAATVTGAAATDIRWEIYWTAYLGGAP